MIMCRKHGTSSSGLDKCSETDCASAKPSYVAVPRPIRPREQTSSVAWFNIFAVSDISTMNVMDLTHIVRTTCTSKDTIDHAIRAEDAGKDPI